jgi:hypothetical protein
MLREHHLLRDNTHECATIGGETYVITNIILRQIHGAYARAR